MRIFAKLVAPRFPCAAAAMLLNWDSAAGGADGGAAIGDDDVGAPEGDEASPSSAGDEAAPVCISEIWKIASRRAKAAANAICGPRWVSDVKRRNDARSKHDADRAMPSLARQRSIRWRRDAGARCSCSTTSSSLSDRVILSTACREGPPSTSEAELASESRRRLSAAARRHMRPSFAAGGASTFSDQATSRKARVRSNVITRFCSSRRTVAWGTAASSSVALSAMSSSDMSA